MPVDETGVVDIIGALTGQDVVALTVSDHLDWNDTTSHLTILQERLNRYLAFIESGELLEKHPAASGKPVQIEVIFKHAPNEEGERFLGKAGAVIVGAGLIFGWRVLAA